MKNQPNFCTGHHAQRPQLHGQVNMHELMWHSGVCQATTRTLSCMTCCPEG